MRRFKRVAAVVSIVFACVLIVGVAAEGVFAADAKSLFNGKDFTGWQNAGGAVPGAGWAIEDGAMIRKTDAGDVWTKERFGNFVLDIEFKTEGNSGIFIRTDNPKDCVQTGIEIQVDRPAKSPSKHSCGAAYDLTAPSKAVSTDGWNHAVICAKGNKVSVELNGEKIVDVDVDQWTTAHQNPDGTPNKFNAALKDFKREGHVGLQDHGAVVAYRNIKITPLD